MKFVLMWSVLLLVILVCLIRCFIALGQFVPNDIIAFELTYENDTDIYIADVKLGLIHNLTHDPTTLNGSPSWLPDGREIMYNSNEAGWTTYIQDVATGEKRKLFADGQGLHPTWSPNGKWLAYIDDIGSQTGGKSGLYLMNKQSGDVRLLSDQIIATTSPFWSPDSRQIAFVSYNQRLNFPIYVIDIDSGKINDLSNNSKGLVSRFDISWSPDSRQIVYTMGSGRNVFLYITDLESGGITRIDNHIGFDAEDDLPAWSPDGRQIAYQSFRDHRYGIYLVDVKTWETRFLATAGNRSNPVWSPTGRMLGFRATDIYTDIYIVDVETGKISPAWNSPGDKSALAWSPS